MTADEIKVSQLVMNEVLPALRDLREGQAEIKASMAAMPSKADHQLVNDRIGRLENWRAGIVGSLALVAAVMSWFADHIHIF